MANIEYIKFENIKAERFLPVLNDETIRGHLIKHAAFDSKTIQDWMNGKIKADKNDGCYIRAVQLDGKLSGWCGIDKDEKDFEIAIVISKNTWGVGISIYKHLIKWAKEYGHREVKINLLETRSEYRFLKKQASKVYKHEMLGRTFVAYHIQI